MITLKINHVNGWIKIECIKITIDAIEAKAAADAKNAENAAACGSGGTWTAEGPSANIYKDSLDMLTSLQQMAAKMAEQSGNEALKTEIQKFATVFAPTVEATATLAQKKAEASSVAADKAAAAADDDMHTDDGKDASFAKEREETAQRVAELQEQLRKSQEQFQQCNAEKETLLREQSDRVGVPADSDNNLDLDFIGLEEAATKLSSTDDPAEQKRLAADIIGGISAAKEAKRARVGSGQTEGKEGGKN